MNQQGYTNRDLGEDYFRARVHTPNIDRAQLRQQQIAIEHLPFNLAKFYLRRGNLNILPENYFDPDVKRTIESILIQKAPQV